MRGVSILLSSCVPLFTLAPVCPVITPHCGHEAHLNVIDPCNQDNASAAAYHHALTLRESSVSEAVLHPTASHTVQNEVFLRFLIDSSKDHPPTDAQNQERMVRRLIQKIRKHQERILDYEGHFLD